MTATITIPRAEYDALIAAREQLQDLEAVVQFQTDPGQGLPLDLMKRLLAGEAPLKLWREHRGLSQNALSRASGVNRIQIGDIEDRGKTGSVATLAKLADALNITIDDLVASPPVSD